MNSSKNFGSFGRMWKLIWVPPRASVASGGSKGVQDDPRQGGEDAGHRDRQDPGDEDAAGDTPADGPGALTRAYAHDRARDDLGSRYGHAEVGRGEQDRGGCRLGREAVDRLELGDTMDHRPHDPPATDG